MHAPVLDMMDAMEAMADPHVDQLTHHLQEQVERNPADFQSLMMLGNGYYLQGKIALSIATFNRALVLNPQDPYAYYHLGVAYYRSAQIDEAIEALTQVTVLAPSMVMAYYWLGIAHFHGGCYREARKAFETLLEKNHESHIAHYHAALICLADREFDAARAHLETLAELGCRDPQVYLHLGEAYYHLHKPTEAMKAYRRGLELNPHNGPLQESLADLVDVQEP
jgi:cytochrome c-type biogenesis protein CcmH/NrfG